MSDLNPIDKKFLNKLFNERGYILDFSNATFADFFEFYGVNIDDEEVYKGSKGARFNKFLEIETNHCVAKILEALFQHKCDLLLNTSESISQYIDRFEGIIHKLQSNPCANINTLKNISHVYIQENINKCNEKINAKDYSGAITNSRSLLEHVLEYIYREITGKDFNTDKLPKKYKALSQKLNLDPAHIDEKISTEELKQIMSGFNSVLSGLACFSNDWADRHARKFDPKMHHAQLAVNSAFTLCEFLLSSYEYQRK